VIGQELATKGHFHITKTRDLTTATLFGKLREKELEMNRFKEQENGKRKVRGLTLKSAGQNEDNNEDGSSECSDVEVLNMLTRRFNKFLKKKGKEKHQQVKRYNRKTNSGSTNLNCSPCGKQRHIKIECLNLSTRRKVKRRKIERMEEQRESILLGKTMTHLLASFQRRMKKLTCA